MTQYLLNEDMLWDLTTRAIRAVHGGPYGPDRTEPLLGFPRIVLAPCIDKALETRSLKGLTKAEGQAIVKGVAAAVELFDEVDCEAIIGYPKMQVKAALGVLSQRWR